MAINPDKQLPGDGETINERYFDALVRHQIGLLRLSGSIRNRIYELLDRTEADIASKIRRQLASVEGLSTPANVRRLNRLLKSIRATRLKSWREVTELWVQEMVNLAKAEPDFADGALKTVVPVVMETTLPPVSLLRSIVTSQPFQGKTLREWASSIARADLERIEGQIKIGLVQGEPSDAIARRVVGTVAQRGRNGVTEITRRNAAAITRTAVNAISNQARREFFKANSDVFQEELYVATLDSRTTPICRANDGKRFPIGQGPIPPLHFNCRSLRVAALDGEAIGSRPARSFTQRQLLREYARREGIRVPASRDALPYGHKGAFDKFSQARVRELTGRVPSKVSYGEWLKRQTREFQDDVLGNTKARLFRRGGLDLDRFINRQGDELTLSQLARRERDAFIAAGLDPEDFL